MFQDHSQPSLRRSFSFVRLALSSALLLGGLASAQGVTTPRPGAPSVPTTAPVTAPGSGQGTGGILPLVSVGERWAQSTESYTIVVSPQDAGKPLGLQVYSPSLNLQDYADGRRGVGYFGDELYKKNEPFQTTFTLSSAGGTVVERRYQASREHSWESLLDGGLPAGTYTLAVRSSGDGKNSFALRVNAPFNLQTSDFSVNARDSTQQDLLAARLTVPQSWVGQTLGVSNYDVDGPQEAQTWVVQPGGVRVNLTTSNDGQKVTDRFVVTQAMVGEWQVYIRVLPTTKQYSNAVQYSFRLGDQPVKATVGGFADPSGLKLANQLVVDVVDPQGRPIPGASYSVGSDNVVRPRLPQGYVPVSATVLEGTGNVASPSELRFTPGNTRLRFVARPPQGALAVDAVAIYGNTRMPLTNVPFEVDGKMYAAPVTVPLAPGSYPVTPSPIPGSTLSPAQPGVVVDGTTGKVTLEYRVLTEVTLSTAPDVLDACDVSQLTAQAKTDFPYRLPGTLNLRLPVGWTSDYPLQLQGDLSASSPIRLKVPVRICRSDSAEAVLVPVDVHATGEARVRDPGGVNVSRTVQNGARLHLTKTAAAIGNSGQTSGTQQGYTITLTLTTDSTLDNVQILDPLPSGGTQGVRGSLNVQGPSLANLQATQSGDTIVLPRVIPGTYTITYTLFSDLPADRILTVPELDW
ncbi:hypothetical protein MF271_04495 [Deinococcus sp. KNUC1210]|uniref:hypothetical protein n=1 Tax=Deinococcus sp. KNUC1210 TaxID=2917691 RepID=UPI001EEFA8B3|nr:hypothetical protein [Deinococcus sp. KNUC1210]ULH15894.1 hypothetical protein MF271_04495 [Deinococcus sp. KNUC1210]